MKKLLLLAAFVAGPILYAQQKPISANELKKDELPKKEQSKTTQTPGAGINVSDTKAVNKKAATRTSKSKTTRKNKKALSFKDAIEN